MPNPLIHTTPGEKIVAYFSTRNLYNVLPAAYNSLLAYSPDVHVYCFIEDDKLPFKTPPQVSCVNIAGQTMFPEDGPNYSTRYSYMILIKAALTKIFPDADRALILDVDTIVCHDISALWHWDLSHAYFAAVKEPAGSHIRGIVYPNFGVCMLNLERLRATGKDDDIINDLNTNKHDFPEQDAFALYCTNRWDPLPPDYNVTKFGFDVTGDPEQTFIKHFAGFQDWSDFEIVQHWLTHKEPPKKYVVYAGDHRVYDMMELAAKSLLAHTDVDKVFFLIEHDQFQRPLPDVIQCINVSQQNVFDPNGPNIMSWYGTMTTLRAGLTKILPPDIDKVLWLDPDTIVCNDISDIWNTELDHKYFAAVEEVRNNNHTLKPYFNAGVMLLNLRKFRIDGMDDKVINEINTVHYEHLEQDVLNYLCHMHTRKLLPCYSESYVSEPCKHPRIHHYLADDKPNFKRAAEPYEQMTWKQIEAIQAELKGGSRK